MISKSEKAKMIAVMDRVYRDAQEVSEKDKLKTTLLSRWYGQLDITNSLGLTAVIDLGRVVDLIEGGEDSWAVVRRQGKGER